MGIDYAGLKQLVRLVPQLKTKKSLLMLGRQKMHFDIQHLRNLANLELKNLGVGISIESLTEHDDFSDSLWKALGVKKIESLDYSDFEGADIVHDLNKPIPKKYQEKYDLVFDGGTLEHVFDVKTSMTNAYNLLAPGGTFMSMSPGNNFFAHGFYQFSPDLVFSFWKRGRGCKVLECMFVPERPRDKTWTIEDPYDTKGRVRMHGKQVAQRCYLYYAVQKPRGKSTRKKDVLQGDYTHLWSEGT
jgi:SAM-dependent methyltransferase